MRHELIDVLALIVAALGLMPLWKDDKRHLLAMALTCFVVIGACYIAWGYYDEKEKKSAELQQKQQEQKEADEKFEAVKIDIVRAVCRAKGDMNFDSIFQKRLDYGREWRAIDDALGLLVDTGKLEVDTRYLPSWDKKAKDPIPLRVWRVRDREYCKTIQ